MSADAAAWGEAAHAAGALYVVAADPDQPRRCYRPPAEYGADIVVAEGQSLGVPLSLRRPVRRPVRLPREVRPPDARPHRRPDDRPRRAARGYVLTLQTREQHIRRERATSNICTSQQLIALVGDGLPARRSGRAACDASPSCATRRRTTPPTRIDALPGYTRRARRAVLPRVRRPHAAPPAEINRALLERGIIGGLDVSDPMRHRMLLCVTEMNTPRRDRRAGRGAGEPGWHDDQILENEPLDGALARPAASASTLPASDVARVRADAAAGTAARRPARCRSCRSSTSCGTSRGSRSSTGRSTRTCTRSAPAR